MTSTYDYAKDKAYSYEAYDERIKTLLLEGKSTGEKQTPNRTEASRLNAQRMSRVHKTVTLSDALITAARQARPQYWMVLTEGWCGDSAHAIPVLDLVSKASEGRIQLGMLLRDEHLDIMDQYLLNGGRSIPRLVAFDTETGEVTGTWGPRPAPAQALMADFKANPDEKRDINVQLQQWYNADKSQTMQLELLRLITGS